MREMSFSSLSPDGFHFLLFQQVLKLMSVTQLESPDTESRSDTTLDYLQAKAVRALLGFKGNMVDIREGPFNSQE